MLLRSLRCSVDINKRSHISSKTGSEDTTTAHLLKISCDTLTYLFPTMGQHGKQPPAISRKEASRMNQSHLESPSHYHLFVLSENPPIFCALPQSGLSAPPRTISLQKITYANMKSYRSLTVTGIAAMMATVPSAAFVNVAPIPVSSRGSSSSLIGNMVSQSASELFQRSLLATKLKNEGRLAKAAGAPASPSTSNSNANNMETFQRNLLAERFKNLASDRTASKDKEKAKQAEAVAAKLAKEKAAAAAAADEKKAAEAAEKARVDAEKEAAEKAEAEKARVAAEKEASEKAEKAKTAAEKAKIVAAEKDAAAAAEKARIAAEKEAAEAAEKARIAAEMKATKEAAEAAKKAEEEKKLAAERAALAAKKRAEKMAEIEAAAIKDLEDLKARSADVKARAKRIADRVPVLSGKSNLLPSADDYSSALARVKEFNPSALKERKETNTELLREVADGMARVVVDGFGTGLDLFEAVREDDDLQSVVGDALQTAKAAVDVLVQQNELDEDDSAAAFQRKARIALIALDSVAVAAYASVCGVLGYGSDGPVNESASRAVGGLFNAITAAAALSVRSADTVVEVTQKVAEEGKDIAEESKSVIDNPAKVVATPEEIKKPASKDDEKMDKAGAYDTLESFQRSLLAERLQSKK